MWYAANINAGTPPHQRTEDERREMQKDLQGDFFWLISWDTWHIKHLFFRAQITWFLLTTEQAGEWNARRLISSKDGATPFVLKVFLDEESELERNFKNYTKTAPHLIRGSWSLSGSLLITVTLSTLISHCFCIWIIKNAPTVACWKLNRGLSTVTSLTLCVAELMDLSGQSWASLSLCLSPKTMILHRWIRQAKG